MSTLVIDTIQGKTTAGSVNVRGEGSNNTNLQQGLAKTWVNYDGTAANAAARDSFNVGSMTDNGSGDATITFTNAMSSANYAAGGMSNAYGSVQIRGTSDSTKPNSTNLRIGSWVSSTNIGDRTYNNIMITGDLS